MVHLSQNNKMRKWKIIKIRNMGHSWARALPLCTKLFYKDANAAILIYDITNKFSFEEIQNYWMKQVKELSPKNIILTIVASMKKLQGNLQKIMLQCFQSHLLKIMLKLRVYFWRYKK